MSHAIVTQDGATAVSLKLKATHTDHATDNQTRNKCNKQTNVVNKSCAFGVFSVGACTVPATFDIRFHRFWKPVSPYFRCNREQSGRAGTVGRHHHGKGQLGSCCCGGFFFNKEILSVSSGSKQLLSRILIIFRKSTHFCRSC